MDDKFEENQKLFVVLWKKKSWIRKKEIILNYNSCAIVDRK